MLQASLLVLLAANPYLDEGKRLLKALDYEKAEKQLELALQVPTSTLDERRDAYHLLVRAKAARGRLDEVEKLYVTMLAADPHAPAPDDVAPKIRDAFRRAKESLYPKDKVELTQLPLGPGRLEVQVNDPWEQVASLVLFELPDRQRQVPVAGFRAHVELGALEPGETRRFWLVARAADGRALASLGTAEKPLEVSAPALPQPAVAAAKAEAQRTAAPPSKTKSLVVPVIITAAAAAAFAVGGGFGLSAQYETNAGRAAMWADERQAHDALAQRRATIANGAYIAGGVLAVGAAIAWVW